MFQSVDPNVDILAPRRLYVVHHGLCSRRTVYFRRLLTADYPGREDQIGQAERMVGMQMGEENIPQKWRPQERQAVRASSGRGAPDHARTGVEQIGSIPG